MKVDKISSKIAGWSLVFLGVGHTITYLTSPKTTLQNEFMTKMKEFSVEILGSKISIFSFQEGFSLIMGLLLFGYGLLNIFILRNNKTEFIPINIVILNVVICLVSFLLSIKYFFIVPIVFTGIAFLGFTISLISKLKK